MGYRFTAAVNKFVYFQTEYTQLTSSVTNSPIWLETQVPTPYIIYFAMCQNRFVIQSR